MLSSQEEQEERKRLIGVAVPRTPGLSDEQKAKLEAKIDEAKRASTLSDHAQSDLEIPGRLGALGKAQVAGATPAQQWPKLPMESPWSGEQPQPGSERGFGKQLHSWDGGSMSVVQERKR